MPPKGSPIFAIHLWIMVWTVKAVVYLESHKLSVKSHLVGFVVSLWVLENAVFLVTAEAVVLIVALAAFLRLLMLKSMVSII